MSEGRSTVTPFTAGCMNGINETKLMEAMSRSERISQSAKDHLTMLLRMESNGYEPCSDYLAIIRQSAADPVDRVSEGWRRKLSEWCYEVVDHFNFDREVVFVALNFLDRSVAIHTDSAMDHLTKREFQLIAVTSLYLAIKLHGETDSTDGPRRKLKIDAFVELSRGFFEVEVIESMEKTILTNLDWRMNPPTSLRFIAFFLRLLPKWTLHEHRPSHQDVAGSIFDVARYLSELAVCVSDFAFTCKTSACAYASILCAIEALQETLPLSYRVRVKFLNNITEVTGLLPESDDIRRIRGMIKELCPSLFENKEIGPFLNRVTSLKNVAANNPAAPAQGDGKTSPVCVADEPEYHSPSGRKRSRTAAETEEEAHSSFV